MSDNIYGTDIAQTSNQDWGVTAQSDVTLVSGPANLQAALERRWGTRVGALFYAPSYGNPIFDHLSENITDDWIEQRAIDARTCLLGDSRLSDVQVTITPNPEKRTVLFQCYWTDVTGNTGTLTQEVSVGV